MPRDISELTHLDEKFNEGLLLHRKGQLAQAHAIYQQVLQLMPGHFEALHLLGVLAGQKNDPARAVEWFGKAIEVKPDFAATHAGRGHAFCQLKLHQEAVDSFRKAIAISPGSAELHFNHGIALYQLLQHQAAIDSFDKAIALRPDIAGTYNNRGLALNACKMHQAAIDSYDKAIAISFDHAAFHYNRGLALNALQRYQEAIDSFDRAIAIEPDYAYVSGEKLYSKIRICDWRNASDDVSELAARAQRNEPVTAPFQVLAVSSSLTLQRKVAELYVKENHPAHQELGVIPKRPRQKKIRLGYFSADFRIHAMGYLTAGLFEKHDKDRFELFAFSFGPESNDEMRQRIAAAFDQFIDVRAHTDQEVAQLARRLQIDIAVDLSGFTQGHRLGIFSYRAAPLQVSYLGYPGTLGADYMDYLIADPTLIPEASQAGYSEKIAYLPHSYQVNDDKRKLADRVFSRQELGLPATGFVFCCFNNSFKITPATFDGWMRILQRVDGSVLWLFDGTPGALDNLRQQARLRGVAAERLVFAKHMRLLPEHLSRLRAADLFIDTLPYNAHTTASDALCAGLPVLTCVGETFASRVAASLLTAMGLPELITSTQEAYEALAIALATQPMRFKAIKEKLQRNLLTTSLFDTRLFTRHLEAAYMQMVERYQNDLAPDYLEVKPPVG